MTDIVKQEFELTNPERGKPRIFPTPEELQKRIDSYFKKCEYEKLPATVEGLAVHLGVVRNTLLNYETKEGYEDYHEIVELAKGRILQGLVEGTLTGKYAAAGAIFNLKNNYGYADKQEINHNVNSALNQVKEINIITPDED